MNVSGFVSIECVGRLVYSQKRSGFRTRVHKSSGTVQDTGVLIIFSGLQVVWFGRRSTLFFRFRGGCWSSEAPRGLIATHPDDDIRMSS